MLTIRLQRVGKKKMAIYRVVIAEKARDNYGNNLEILGNYNPHKKEAGLILKEDRVKYWLTKGAQLSNTINNLFIKAGLIVGKKKKSVTISRKRTVKLGKKKVVVTEIKPKADEAVSA